MVCSEFAPRAGASKKCGKHDLKALSVVNGAQTVGTIALVSQTLDLDNSHAKVMLTVIESKGVATFETRVTQTRNTQNRVRASDFAAQDSNQERLRLELAVSGIAYHYKPSEERINPEATQVLFEEAAYALACFSGRMTNVAIARRSPSQLMNPLNDEYKRLFTDSLTGASLYRKVSIFRLLNQIADETERAASSNSAERMFYRHMRFFIMHFFSKGQKQRNRLPVGKSSM